MVYIKTKIKIETVSSSIQKKLENLGIRGLDLYTSLNINIGNQDFIVNYSKQGLGQMEIFEFLRKNKIKFTVVYVKEF